MADAAGERRRHHRAAVGFRAGGRPGPQSLSRGAAPCKDHIPHTLLSTLRCLRLRRHICVLEQTAQ